MLRSLCHRSCRPAVPTACLIGLVLLVWTGDLGATGGLGQHAPRLYRDDPRPAGDLPAGVRPSTESAAGSSSPRRRLSRRARRLSRRGLVIPPDGPSTTADLQAPVPPHSGLRIDHRGLPYGQVDASQRFNLHLPGGCRTGRLPLVIWVPGRDWTDASRADCPILWLTDRGFAVASIGYRPSPISTFPRQRDDCQQAMNRIVHDAAVWGIDPSRIAVVGQAAGGHLAMLLGLDDSPSTTADDPAPPRRFRVAAICGVSSITHLPTLGPEHDRASSAASRLIGGPLPELREAALAASPLRYASAGDPPTLLIHPRSDATIPASQSERLHAALEAVAVDSTLILTDAEPGLTASSEAGRLLLAFLRRTLVSELDSVIIREAAPAPAETP